MAKRKNIYAGFWFRFFAWIIDMFVLFGIGLILALLLLMIGSDFPAPSDESASNALSVVIAWMYYASMESSAKQATFGKMALDLKVTDLDGKRISFGRATGRFFSKILSGLILGMGFFMIAFTPKKQGLHDKISGCLVLKR